MNDIHVLGTRTEAVICDNEGYWRKQMEHICGHLKVHATDSVNFRALVAQPRLGKVSDVLMPFFNLVLQF